MAYENLAGKRYGKLTVIESAGKDKHGNRLWRCVCDCGNEITTIANSLRKNRTKSCGCFKFEAKRIHGEYKTRLYKIWVGFRQRCTNPNYPGFHNYGGRGIAHCEEWNDYFVFRDWALKNGYRENLSLDRINNNGNYEPSNCRWATPETQANNKRTCHTLTYNEKTQSATDWAKELGFKPYMVQYWAREGLSVGEMLVAPYIKKPRKACSP